MLRYWLVYERGGTKPSGACLSTKALAIYFMMGRASSPWPYEIEWKPNIGPARGMREKQRLCGVHVPVCVNLWTGEELFPTTPPVRSPLFPICPLLPHVSHQQKRQAPAAADHHHAANPRVYEEGGGGSSAAAGRWCP